MATVFISHSAHGDALAGPYLECIRKVLQGRHEVLLDETGLRAGDYWNNVIVNWMYICDVAIVLCSRKALESTYVSFEVSNLVGRLRRETAHLPTGGGPAVRIYPVLIPDLSFGDLQKSSFSKFGFDQLHPLRPTSVDDVAKWLETAIPDTPACSPIVSELLATLTEILKDRHPDLLASAAREANLVLRPGTPRGDYAALLARHLAASNLLTANRALRKLRPVIGEAADRILQLLAPCWVSPEAALELREIVEPSRETTNRCAVINSHMADFTPDMYLRRARGGLPGDVGIVVQLNPPAVVNAVALLRTELRRELATKLEVDEDDPSTTPEKVEAALARKIADGLDGGDPVIAVLARNEMPERAYYALIDALQSVPFLEHVAFIALCGNSVPGDSALSARRRLLEPLLEPSQEDRAHEIYARIDSIFRRPTTQRA